MKTKVAVFFGGRSVEHEVSIISGLQAYRNIDRSKFDPIAVYITKDNAFYVGDGVDDITAYKDIPALLEQAVRVLPVKGERGMVDLIRFRRKLFADPVVASFEVAMPVVHGTNVEDGTLMGLLEMLGVPYTGCDVTASAVGMDKYLMKAALRQAGIPVLPAVSFTGHDFITHTDDMLAGIEKVVGFPVIVKPVNLGSSVGISKAKDRDSLADAMNEAFGYAPRVLIEHAVEPLREINCAVIGDIYNARPSACEEPIGSDEILSFGDKYVAGGKSAKNGGMSSLKRRCPAELTDEETEKVKRLAVDTFRALGCSGVARVDFLNNTETGEWYVNEINTIPGSLAFYLFEAEGTSFADLLTEMIDLAFKRERERESLSFSFDNNLLANASFGGAKGKA